MSAKLFNDEFSYCRKDIKPKLGNVSDRTLDVLLRGLPRIAFSRKLIVYRGVDLNALVDSAATRGNSRLAPFGAAAGNTRSKRDEA